MDEITDPREGFDENARGIDEHFNELSEKQQKEEEQVEEVDEADVADKGIGGKIVRFIAAIIIGIAIVLSAIGLYEPEILSSIINIALIIFTSFFVLFIVVGIAVLFGARDRVVKILEQAFEGTLKVLDLLELIRIVFRELIILLQETILFIVPFIAFAIAGGLYLLLIWTFRVWGSEINLVYLMIAITIIAVSVLNFLNLGNLKTQALLSFTDRLKARFKRFLVDFVEIAIVLFFFTMDHHNLPIIPVENWGEVHADLNGINFMAVGLSLKEGIGIGLALAGLAMFVESVRRVYKVVLTASVRFKGLDPNITMFTRIKEALRISFSENLDDLIKYIGYNTVLLFVFMFLPRLKLVSMIAFSFTNLVWDVLISKRVFVDKESDDLLSRIIVKVFKL